MDNYYQKYLKYKKKYLELVNIQSGGARRNNIPIQCRDNVRCIYFDCRYLHPVERPALCNVSCLDYNCTLLHPRGRIRLCRFNGNCTNINCTFLHECISTNFISRYDPNDVINRPKIRLQEAIVNIINNSLRYTELSNSNESRIYNSDAPTKLISPNERAILLLKKFYIDKLNCIIEDVDVDGYNDFTILYRNIGRDYNYKESLVPLIKRQSWNETCEFLVTSIITFCQFLILFLQGYIKNADFIVFTELCYDASYINIINNLLRDFGYYGYFVSLRRDCKDYRIDQTVHGNINQMSCEQIRGIDKSKNDQNYKISGIIYKPKFRLNQVRSQMALTGNCITESRNQSNYIIKYRNIYLIKHYYFDLDTNDKNLFTECIGQYAQKGIFSYESSGYTKFINIYNIHISSNTPSCLDKDSFIKKALNKILNNIYTNKETFIIVGDTNCKSDRHMNDIIYTFNTSNYKKIKYNMSILNSNLGSNKCKNCTNIYDSIIFNNIIKISDIQDYSSHYYFISKYKFKTDEEVNEELQELDIIKDRDAIIMIDEGKNMSDEDNYMRNIMDEETERNILAYTPTQEELEEQELEERIRREDAETEALFDTEKQER
jgi:hypothetical protein